MLKSMLFYLTVFGFRSYEWYKIGMFDTQKPMKKFFLALLLVGFFTLAIEPPFLDVPEITQAEMASYLLPEDHHLAPILDKLFKNPDTLIDEKAFKRAGFKILHKRSSSMIVASHPALKGHLVKVHLQNSTRNYAQVWENFANRCKGADNVRKLIREKHIRHFTVADKWIYFPKVLDPMPVLVVTDMQTVSKEKSTLAWKTKITRRHLREIFCLVSHGFASTSFPSNIPYTKNKKFAFVDTERPFRVPFYDHARAHLSEEMQLYWDELMAKKFGH